MSSYGHKNFTFWKYNISAFKRTINHMFTTLSRWDIFRGKNNLTRHWNYVKNGPPNPQIVYLVNRCWLNVDQNFFLESMILGLSNAVSDVPLSLLVAEISAASKKPGLEEDLSQEWNIWGQKLISHPEIDNIWPGTRSQRLRVVEEREIVRLKAEIPVVKSRKKYWP